MRAHAGGWREPASTPPHRLTISKGFLVGRTRLVGIVLIALTASALLTACGGGGGVSAGSSSASAAPDPTGAESTSAAVDSAAATPSAAAEQTSDTFGTVAAIAAFLDGAGLTDQAAVKVCSQSFAKLTSAVTVPVADATQIGKVLLSIPEWPFDRNAGPDRLAIYEPDEKVTLCVSPWIDDPAYANTGFTSQVYLFYPGGATMVGFGAYGPASAGSPGAADLDKQFQADIVAHLTVLPSRVDYAQAAKTNCNFWSNGGTATSFVSDYLLVQKSNERADYVYLAVHGTDTYCSQHSAELKAAMEAAGL